MANEIQITGSVRVRNGNFISNFSPGGITADQSTIGRGGHAQVIGNAASELVDFGDISNAGWCTLKNLEAEGGNFVEYGLDGGGGTLDAVGRLLPGEFAILRLTPSVAMFALADTAPVKLDVTVYEN